MICVLCYFRRFIYFNRYSQFDPDVYLIYLQLIGHCYPNHIVNAIKYSLLIIQITSSSRLNTEKK